MDHGSSHVVTAVVAQQAALLHPEQMSSIPYHHPECDYQGILLMNNVPQGDPIMGTRTQVLFSSKETSNSKEVSGSEKEYGREWPP